MEGLLDDSSLLHMTVIGMKRIVVEAFKKLFRSNGLTDAWRVVWQHIAPRIVSKVSARQRAKLELPLSQEEITSALGALPSRKSPGHAGFPPEFYRLFWADLGPLVLTAAKDAWAAGTMSMYHNAGLICLCPKGGDLRLVSQWRPITLLPMFYKILAIVLALHLQDHMDEWLEVEQRGFCKGRSIADNLVLFREAKWLCFIEQLVMTFLQLDFSKAFDRVEWHFMQAGLLALGFGLDFCRWVSILCEDAKSSVIVNGEKSDSFPIFRSVRQGCPLAPYLVVLVSDIFIQILN